MSGHSKWATIKHQKAATDKARGKLFAKLIRQIEVAARNGGAEVESNATLRGMVQKARAASVPKDTIQKAIRRGTGEEQGTSYEAITYEGYAPGGVAVLVSVLTDNRNRTGAEIRAVFSKMGGSMAEPGAVAWQFSRKGQLSVPRSASEEELLLVALEAGAEDVRDDLDVWTITTEPNDLEPVQSAIEGAGLTVTSAEVTMVASTSVPVTDADDARKVLRILDAFEDNDDVQDVYSNADLDDEVLTGIEA